MRIAIYKHLKYEYTTAGEVAVYADNAGYVRVSGIIDLDFVMMEKKDYTAAAMAAFDEQEKAVNLMCEIQKKEIDTKRQEFLAITHEGKE